MGYTLEGGCLNNDECKFKVPVPLRELRAENKAQAQEIEDLKAQLDWWQNLIKTHHDNEKCPSLKAYIESLQSRIEELEAKYTIARGEVSKQRDRARAAEVREHKLEHKFKSCDDARVSAIKLLNEAEECKKTVQARLKATTEALGDIKDWADLDTMVKSIDVMERALELIYKRAKVE